MPDAWPPTPRAKAEVSRRGPQRSKDHRLHTAHPTGRLRLADGAPSHQIRSKFVKTDLSQKVASGRTNLNQNWTILAQRGGDPIRSLFFQKTREIRVLDPVLLEIHARSLKILEKMHDFNYARPHASKTLIFKETKKSSFGPIWKCYFWCFCTIFYDDFDQKRCPKLIFCIFIRGFSVLTKTVFCSVDRFAHVFPTIFAKN